MYNWWWLQSFEIYFKGFLFILRKEIKENTRNYEPTNFFRSKIKNIFDYFYLMRNWSNCSFILINQQKFFFFILFPTHIYFVQISLLIQNIRNKFNYGFLKESSNNALDKQNWKKKLN